MSKSDENQLVVFIYPSGEEVRNADLDVYRDFLSDPKRYYEPGGCGEAAREIRKDDGGIMGVRFVPEYGFSIEIRRRIPAKDSYGASFISCSSENPGHRVETYVGGMVMPLPSESCHNAQTTLRIIQDFLESCRRSEVVSWTRTDDLSRDIYGQ